MYKSFINHLLRAFPTRQFAATSCLLACAGLTILCTSPSAVPADTLSAAIDQHGLSALLYQGVNLLGDGTLSLQSAVLSKEDGTTVPANTTPVSTTYDQASRKLLQAYDWGLITCVYQAAGSRLNLTISVTNKSDGPLSALTMQLLSLHFPAPPNDWVHDYQYVGSNLGDPTIEIADYGSAEIAVCNDDVTGKPLLTGFPGRASLIDRPVVISTTPGWVFSPYLDKRILRPIAPGATDVYKISLRFAPSGTWAQTVGADLISALAKAFPNELDWPDRRPIGTIHLATSDDPHHSITNSAGWLLDPTGIDVTSVFGRAAFKARILKYADDSIAILKDNNSQGIIVWDIEGEAHGNVVYYGDPRQIGKLAPEMDAIADEFFKKFTAAGLKTGVCIRPQDLVNVGASNISQNELSGQDEIVKLLLSKVEYAYKRWGCTLFYVDSNGDPNVPYDVSIFKSLFEKMTAENIHGLLIPEHKNLRYFAYTAPYAELRLGYVEIPSIVRAAYPKAFECNYIPDGPVDQDRAALVKAVKDGQVLMFRGWWQDPFNARLKSIYSEATNGDAAAK